MATLVPSDTKMTLKYADKDTFTFSKFKQSATDEDIVGIAKVLNAFQDQAYTSVIKTVTSSIL